MTIDVLGEPFVAETLTFPDDDEGQVTATLVHRPTDEPSGKAVLHVHGFCDYFFHTEYAEWWNERGYDFYAIDLPKYGRSLLPHQTPNYTTDLAEYFPVLDEAWSRIVDAHQQIVVTGHSTGGLITPLWVDDRQPTELVGMFLNSPWFDLQGSDAVRVVGTPVIKQVGKRQPMRILPRSVSGHYAKSLHRDHGGEWDFNLDWKSLESFPVRLGWLRAIRNAQHQLHRGLDVPAPVLVLSSDRSTVPKTMNEDVFTTDIVLEVRHMRKWATRVGTHVTYVAVEGGVHDLVLSREPVRKQVYAELGRWLDAYVR